MSDDNKFVEYAPGCYRMTGRVGSSLVVFNPEPMKPKTPADRFYAASKKATAAERAAIDERSKRK
jgi:hypothetical protein